MDKFIRYWNQNRKKIIMIILIIVFIIILIQLINFLLKENNNKETEKNTVVIDKDKPIQSVITGQNVSEEETEENVNIMQEFIDYNNLQNYQSSYDLLTEECKNVVFQNDINNYINNYAKKIFSSKKTYNSELWLQGSGMLTYRVTYYNDNLLATGGSSMNENFQDYITVTEKNGEKKLNINNFIEQKQIGKQQKVNDIEITVNYKNVFQSYETYNITVKNYTSKTIMLNDGKDSKGICLLDKNDVEYSAFLNEIPVNRLSLESGYQKDIDIRFNKMYTLERKITKMKFKNIILDEETYEQNTNAENIEKVEITINI